MASSRRALKPLRRLPNSAAARRGCRRRGPRQNAASDRWPKTARFGLLPCLPSVCMNDSRQPVAVESATGKSGSGRMGWFIVATMSILVARPTLVLAQKARSVTWSTGVATSYLSYLGLTLDEHPAWHSSAVASWLSVRRFERVGSSSPRRGFFIRSGVQHSVALRSAPDGASTAWLTGLTVAWSLGGTNGSRLSSRRREAWP